MAFFGELYLRSTRPFLAPEATAQECGFIASALDLAPGVRALDIGCGHGRHLEPLAARGLDVLGFDLDPESLVAISPELRARVVRADLFAPPFAGCFQAAFSWYATLFGSDDDARNLEALRAAVSVLAPGGRLLVHGHNPTVQAREPQSHFETTLADGARLVEETWYDLAANALHGHRILTDGARRLEGRYLVRCFTAADHARMASRLGLGIEATWGDAQGNPYAADSPDLIVRYARPVRPRRDAGS